MEITRTFDILNLYKEKFIKDDVLAGKEQGVWVKYSSEQYVDIATHLSYGLVAYGLKKGEVVATISNSRPEWNFMDMAITQAGMIHLPIYPTISAEEYDYILNHAEPTMVVVSDQALFDKINPICEKINSVNDIFTYNEIEGKKNWKELLELGRQKAEEVKDKLEEIKASIKPDDLVTLIYTSGTTGFPKGVMLSHNNLISNIKATVGVHTMDHRHRSLSFLPLSHVYERMLNYHFQYKGISIYYAENMGTIAENAREIKPHIFSSVPRLLERVYDKIIGKGKDLKGIKKSIFFWAVNLGLRFEFDNKNGAFYNRKLKLARKLIFSKWKEALGGNIEIIVSGSASLAERLARVFWAADIRVLEGYGLTETSPVIAVSDEVKNEMMFGTVGPVIDGVEVKIAEDGEILCKGPNVMLGYYKQPELTAEVIDKDGWFHTGDIGVLVDGKYLKITDRKKEIFKLSSGKYIAPQVIELKLKESFFIEQTMVIGENEKFASALISPNFPFLHEWASRHDIKYRDNKELIGLKEVQERFRKEVDEVNLKLGEHEKVKRIRLVEEEWSPQTGEMSPTLKLKRKVLYDKYDPIVKEIYSAGKN
ncbi:MAG: long-chain fatty acid--CoA ligase [Bacteroidales bacterium]|nr:long-chain fatty acid--CoA ligase [Bacteroidales bacterium]